MIDEERDKRSKRKDNIYRWLDGIDVEETRRGYVGICENRRSISMLSFGYLVIDPISLF